MFNCKSSSIMNVRDQTIQRVKVGSHNSLAQVTIDPRGDKISWCKDSGVLQRKNLFEFQTVFDNSTFLIPNKDYISSAGDTND